MEIGHAARPAENETVCGDASTIVSDGGTLVAIADGLGHGPIAAQASEAFCEHVRRNADRTLEDILTTASEELRHTRGVACALLRIDASERSLTFAGVGNIELVAISSVPIHPVCTPGIVGQRLHRLQTFTYDLAPEDLIVVFTDGISSRLDLKPLRFLPPQEIADELLRIHGKGHDDATCIAIRIEDGHGGPSD